MLPIKDLPVSPQNDDQIIWGLKGIGAIAGGLTAMQVRWLLKTGKLTTKRIGRRHVTTPSQIYADLGINK